MKKLLFLITFSPVISFAQSWVTQYNGEVYDISFPDSLHGRAAGGRTTSGNGRILFSDDCGSTWNEQSVYFTVGSDSACYVTNIVFADSMVSWAGGWWRTNHTISGYFGSGWVLLSGYGGGYSISKSSVSSHYDDGCVTNMETAGGQLFWVYYTGTAKDYQVYINGKAIGGYYGAPVPMCFIDIYHGWVLIDGKLNKTITGVNGLNPLYDFPGISDFDFIDTLHGWAVGDSGKILYTDDGGADSVWDALTSGVTDTLTCIKFVDSLNGWAGGKNVILRTRDGGVTWVKEATLGANQYGIQKICALDTIHVWAFFPYYNSLYPGKILRYHPYVGIEESGSSVLSEAKLALGGPNPFINSTIINYGLPFTNCPLRVSVYDLSGSLVDVIGVNRCHNLCQSVPLGKNLKAGIYFVKVGNSPPLKITKIK